MLFTKLLKSFPPRSYDVSICPVSFRINEYFGFLTMYTLLTHIYYVTFVQWGRKKELDAAIGSNLLSPIFRHITHFESIISQQSLYPPLSSIICSFPFIIAAFVHFLDQCQLHGIVPPKDESGGNTPLVIHRGEAILSVSNITNADCSLTTLNYSKEVDDMLLSILQGNKDRINVVSCMYYTSYIQITSYFALAELENLRSPVDPESERLLKCLSLALMRILYV